MTKVVEYRVFVERDDTHVTVTVTEQSGDILQPSSSASCLAYLYDNPYCYMGDWVQGAVARCITNIVHQHKVNSNAS